MKQSEKQQQKNKVESSDSEFEGSDDPSLPISKRLTQKEAVPTAGEAAAVLIALSARKEDEARCKPNQDDRIVCQIYLLPSSDTPGFSNGSNLPICFLPCSSGRNNFTIFRRTYFVGHFSS
jgi:hypothetical protein